MKQEGLQELFNKHKEALTSAETPEGHQARFLNKIQTHKKTTKNKHRLWLSIAASLVILLGVGFTVVNSNSSASDLASVSPEMEATQSFFTNTIQKELNKLEAYEDDASKIIIKDALFQLNKLEKEYDALKIDLAKSGQNKRVITAMIENFQNRIELLTMVTSQIEAFKTLKTNTNETTL